MDYQTRIVRSEQEWNVFLDLPYQLYRNNSAWVAPLRSEVANLLDAGKNPYFQGVCLEKFVGYRDGEPVARGIVVVNPKHWEKYGKQVAFFGFFESVNDEYAVRDLFSAMERYSLSKGATYLEGPFNPNHYNELGLLVKNFGQPVFFEPYNPPFYADLLRAAGFELTTELYTNISKNAEQLAAIAHNTEIIHQAKQAGFTLRNFNLLHFRADLERIREVYNDAFDENWHFLPVSQQEYHFAGKSMFLVANPSHVQLVEYQGEPVGVLQFVLNINPILKQLKGRLQLTGLLRFIVQRFAIKEVILYAVGIKKAYRQTLAVSLLEWALADTARRYPVIYTTWMMDSNIRAVKSAERMGFVPYKWFAIFGKSIQNQDNG